jgi:type II secretory pathway pseudopilin PulG
MSSTYRRQFRISDFGLRIGVSQAASCFDGGRERRRSHVRNPQSAIRNPQSFGLSLIEVVASTLIVGVMAVAALNSLGAATRSAESIGNRAVALGLANELMSEILSTAYGEPSGSSSFGPDGSESAGPRSAFDDVDDYDGWNQSPPQYRDGSTMPDRADWRHRVAVLRVVPNDPTQTSGTEQGAKRIRVTIEYRNQVLAELIAVRTNTDPP